MTSYNDLLQLEQRLVAATLDPVRSRTVLQDAAAVIREIREQKPVEWQYQDREGNWRHFSSDYHRDSTINSGQWPIRNLYARPVVASTEEKKHDITK
jgi:hypothetical protein